MANIQISTELWDRIVAYHQGGAHSEALDRLIIKGIEEKQEAQRRRRLYSESKNGASAELREQARQDYLDTVGVPEDYRW